MRETITGIIRWMEDGKINFPLWLAAFSSIIAVRVLVENWLAGFRNRSGLFLFYEFAHTFLFFLVSYILFVALLKNFLKVELKKAANVLLWGFLIILTPPIADYIISGGRGYWSFYEFDSLAGLVKRFFTFYGETPEIGITYGVRIEVAAALFFIFLYSLVKLHKSEMQSTKSETIPEVQNLKLKRSWIFVIRIFNLFRISNFEFRILAKSLGIIIIAYFIFFILGTFPSYPAIAVEGFSAGFLSVSSVDIARMFLTPAKIFSREIPDIVNSLNIKMSLVYSLVLILLSVLSCWWLSPEKTKSFLKNARYPQLIYHGGLLIIGMGLAYVFAGAFFEITFFNVVGFLVLLAAVFCAWLASLVPNDIYDLESDRLTANKSRPLVREIFSPEEYKALGWVLFAASIFFSAIVSFKIALFLLAYQAIAWLYSSWPLRLKRLAFVSTFISALASLMVLFSGYILVAPDQGIRGLPFSLVALLVAGYTLSLPIKDFKDIEGDRKNGIFTVPVLFGEYWGKIAVGSGLFVSFMLSVVVFNEFRLFWWAALVGGTSYWIILSSGENNKVAYKRLPWWILGVLVVYGLILIKIVFL